MADARSLAEGSGIFASAANILEAANILFLASRSCGKFFRGLAEVPVYLKDRQRERKRKRGWTRERKNLPRRLARSAESLVRNHESFISFGDKKRKRERKRERDRNRDSR